MNLKIEIASNEFEAFIISYKKQTQRFVGLRKLMMES